MCASVCVCMCMHMRACVRVWCLCNLDGEGGRVYASTATDVVVWTAMYLTGYSDILIGLCEPLSPPYGHYYWSLLYSAILRLWADSLRSHVVLHEWIAFYSAFLNIHRSGVLTALAWLVPQKSAARESISVRSAYTIQPCTMSLHAKPHT